ncbi:MAG: tetratricopeptide repeat protein [Immundisolibacteraceae bacterium]|nr:tetratricopeptide repeat protein [Immundisolibacteraceae bacterium]
MSNQSKPGDEQVPVRARFARRRFARLVEAGEPLDLTEIALTIAQEERPDLELAACRESLRELVESYREIRDSVGPTSARDEARLLCRFLAEEQGYQGNSEEYYDPDNSYIDQVLERRMGIPITLALLYIHVGRGVGLQVEGVGFPGHFLVAVEVGSERSLIDPFSGRLVTETGLRELLDQHQGPAVPLQDDFSQPITGREMVLRMLNNLKGVYHQHGDYPRLLACCDRILLLEPNDVNLLLQRIAVYQRLQQPGLALAELGRLRAKVGNAEFRQRLEQMMLAIEIDKTPLQ